MQDRLRRGTVPSPSVPVPPSTVCALELLLPMVILLAPVIELVVPRAGTLVLFVDIGWTIAFVTPHGLALVALGDVVQDGLSVGAVVIALLAVITLYIAFASVSVLFYPAGR